MKKSVQAQALYLANLLLLPGLSFLLIAWSYHKLVWTAQKSLGNKNSKVKIKDAFDLAMQDKDGKPLSLKQRRVIESTISQAELDQSHFRAAFWLSLIGGSSVIGGSSLIYFFMQSTTPWPLIIVYFTIMHTSFVMWGMVNLAQAMSSRLPYFKVL